MDKLLVVKVPITVKGEAKGIKQQGGLLDIVHREVEVECLPADIPEHIEIDVTELMLGQAIRLRDVATSPTWRPVTDPDVMLVHVVAPRAVVEPVAADAAGGDAGGGGRARGHQEGQGREGEKKKK